MNIGKIYEKIMPKRRENIDPVKKKLPEEIELESYLEQERVDKLRHDLFIKRKEHNSLWNFKPRYDYNKGVVNHFQNPKVSKNKLVKTHNLYFKEEGRKKT